MESNIAITKKILVMFLCVTLFDGALFGNLINLLINYTCTCSIPTIMINLFFFALCSLLMLYMFGRIKDFVVYGAISRNIYITKK